MGILSEFEEEGITDNFDSEAKFEILINDETVIIQVDK